MTMKSTMRIAAAGIAAGMCFEMALCGGCRPDLSHQRQISLPSVQGMTSGSIAGYEEKCGEIFVSIGDNSGDCHIYVLQHPGMSRKQAMEALKAKKTELERRTSESPALLGGSEPAASGSSAPGK
jgi:hypothetical protein